MLRTFFQTAVRAAKLSKPVARTYTYTSSMFQMPKEPPSASFIREYLAKNPIMWTETGDTSIPYQTKIDGRELEIHLNDFPDEWLYSVKEKYSKETIMDVNGLIDNWTSEKPVQSISNSKP